jgi:ribonucleoside-triphosphate reductase
LAKAEVKMSKKLPTDYQSFIHKSRYSRWLENEKRREDWHETVDRYLSFVDEHLKEKYEFVLPKNLKKQIRDYILDLEVMPSMRAMMSAGEALKRDHIAGYNCSYVQVDNQKVFAEILYVLMCGTGVGFSVERQFVNELPDLPSEIYDTETIIKVRDSKIGWAKALKELIALLYTGQCPKYDLTKIRPKGSILKTFGGRASGPEPLDKLFRFVIHIFKQAVLNNQRKLSSIQCHDIICHIGNCVVVGGVRRSALISLSNLSDDRMRQAKMGQWWEENSQRSLANNSVSYTEKPEMGMFINEWKSLYDSKSGERGIFSRYGAVKKAKENGRRDPNGHHYGTNPCGEILLRNMEFCNLTEVVVRDSDTPETLKKKIEIATILGTIQSTLTDFKFISSDWKKNCEEERLLGVSLTGVMDSSLTNKVNDKTKKLLLSMRDVAVKTNKKWADKFNINVSVAITCNKPSGTISQLVDCSSGVHTRHSEYYLRTVRADNSDPLCKFMIESGFPYEKCVTNPDYVTVFSFPMKSPSGCITRKDLTAIEQLEIWKMYKEYWCEHNPSVTISVRENEWMAVGSWVYENFDSITGVSFLPYSEHIYPQAPYQDLTKEQYTKALENMPKSIDWNKLKEYESEDNTTSSQELSCSAGSCEVVDITK